jgi:hypothetical protein
MVFGFTAAQQILQPLAPFGGRISEYPQKALANAAIA